MELNTLLIDWYNIGDVIGYWTCFLWCAIGAWAIYFVMKNYLEG